MQEYNGDLHGNGPFGMNTVHHCAADAPTAAVDMTVQLATLIGPATYSTLPLPESLRGPCAELVVSFPDQLRTTLLENSALKAAEGSTGMGLGVNSLESDTIDQVQM